MATTSNLERKLTRELSALVRKSGGEDGTQRKEVPVSYSDLLQNKMLLISLIQEGVPYSLFDLIQDFAPYSEDNWANFLALSTRSLHRYRQDEKVFGILQSEKIMEIAEVTKMGVDVFGKMDKFKLWLETPNYSLGNAKPISLLAVSYGKELVMGELVRIDHGIFV